MELNFEHRAGVYTADELAVLRDIAERIERIPLPQRRDGNAWGLAHVLNTDRTLGTRLMSTFCSSACHDWAMSYFPQGYVFLLKNCSFRYHDPSDTKSHLPLHLDANFVGLDARVMNFWTPITDITSETPGLTFLDPAIDPTRVLRRWVAAFTAARRADPDRFPSLTFSREDLAKTFGRAIDDCFVVPRPKSGDVLAFNQYVLHGTEPNMGGTRRSFEFRVCGRGSVPSEYRADIATPNRDGDGWSLSLELVGSGASVPSSDTSGH